MTKSSPTLSAEGGTDSLLPVAKSSPEQPGPSGSSHHDASTVESATDIESSCVARVLEVIPDVDPDYVAALVVCALQIHRDRAVEHVLHALFDDPRHSKATLKRKTKHTRSYDSSEESSADMRNSSFDYGDHNRPFTGGPNYNDLTLVQLRGDFPLVPVGIIQYSLRSLNGLYAPTHLLLLEKYKKYERAKRFRNICTKFRPGRTIFPFRRLAPFCGKPDPNIPQDPLHDDEFSRERAWLIQESMDRAGYGVECGCCFATFHFHEVVQCPEAHLFCTPCMLSYASTLLGAHDPRIQCIDRSGCTALLRASELRQFMPKKMMQLWESVQQRTEIVEAGLEGLEECPFCDYSVVIENEMEKLLRCANHGVCGVVSCRECRKPDHLPKRCQEEEDAIIDGRHTIEEAMSGALIRNCPECRKPFVKELGCNVMVCPSPGCGTISCYVCRKKIDGHGHLEPGIPCASVVAAEVQHANDVNEAHRRTLEKYKHDHPDIDEERVKIA